VLKKTYELSETLGQLSLMPKLVLEIHLPCIALLLIEELVEEASIGQALQC